jgi:hypothetical protein
MVVHLARVLCYGALSIGCCHAWQQLIKKQRALLVTKVRASIANRQLLLETFACLQIPQCAARDKSVKLSVSVPQAVNNPPISVKLPQTLRLQQRQQ